MLEEQPLPRIWGVALDTLLLGFKLGELAEVWVRVAGRTACVEGFEKHPFHRTPLIDDRVTAATRDAGMFAQESKARLGMIEARPVPAFGSMAARAAPIRHPVGELPPVDIRVTGCTAVVREDEQAELLSSLVGHRLVTADAGDREMRTGERKVRRPMLHLAESYWREPSFGMAGFAATGA